MKMLEESFAQLVLNEPASEILLTLFHIIPLHVILCKDPS